MTSFQTLRSLVPKAGAPSPATEAMERCELCSAPVGPRHRHLVEPVARRLICACDACALLFLRTGATQYKSVPRSARRLASFQMSDAQWDALLIPIGLAFFLKSSVQARVLAFYPSPAGPTESHLPLEAWAELERENPALEKMEPDVEALLVNRLDKPAVHLVAPIDKCYELVGMIRASWRGLSGGDQVWSRIREFFAALEDSAGA